MSSHPATRRPHNGATKGADTGRVTRVLAKLFVTHTHSRQSGRWAWTFVITIGLGQGERQAKTARERKRETVRGKGVAHADRTNWFAKQSAFCLPLPSMPLFTSFSLPSNCQPNTHKWLFDSLTRVRVCVCERASQRSQGPAAGSHCRQWIKLSPFYGTSASCSPFSPAPFALSLHHLPYWLTPLTWLRLPAVKLAQFKSCALLGFNNRVTIRIYSKLDIFSIFFSLACQSRSINLQYTIIIYIYIFFYRWLIDLVVRIQQIKYSWAALVTREPLCQIWCLQLTRLLRSTCSYRQN